MMRTPSHRTGGRDDHTTGNRSPYDRRHDDSRRGTSPTGSLATGLLAVVGIALIVTTTVGAATAVGTTGAIAADADAHGLDETLDPGPQDAPHEASDDRSHQEDSHPGAGEDEAHASALSTPLEERVLATAGSGAAESVVLLAAYSRYDDTSPLEHPLRAALAALVAAAPGIHLARAAARTDSTESTVRYHVRILEHENEIETASVWGKHRLYPVGIDASTFERHAALRDEASSRVLEAVARNEPATVSTLSADLDRATSTVSEHVSRLEEAELLTRERTGESVEIRLSADLAAAMPGTTGADARAVGASGD